MNAKGLAFSPVAVILPLTSELKMLAKPVSLLMGRIFYYLISLTIKLTVVIGASMVGVGLITGLCS
ncbi:MAG: hypothetical protein AB8V21_08045 [Arsenophonus endosymbiont of Dermacentor nuttalli]